MTVSLPLTHRRVYSQTAARLGPMAMPGRACCPRPTLRWAGWTMLAALLLAAAQSAPAALEPDPCHWTSERLPSSVAPTHYNLTLRPLANAGTFSGTVAIDAHIVAPTRCVVLHTGPNLTVSSMAVDGVAIASWRRNATSEMLTLELAHVVSAGPLALRFAFGGNMHGSVGQSYPANRGLYRIAVNDTVGHPSWMAISELWVRGLLRLLRLLLLCLLLIQLLLLLLLLLLGLLGLHRRWRRAQSFRASTSPLSRRASRLASRWQLRRRAST